MLGTSTLTALLGSAPAADSDLSVLKAYTRALVNEGGLSLFLVTPGGKTPVDCRAAAAKKKAEREAAAAGKPKPSGVHMATDNTAHLASWLNAYRKGRSPDTPVNMAAEVGRSRLVVVDVDTPEELDAFRSRWAAEADDPRLLHVSPTVTSPGVRNEAGEWVHHGGGHFYFTLPDGMDLSGHAPGSKTVGTDEAKFSVFWNNRYVLIPPSVRPEGPYTVTGTDHPAPPWLLELIGDEAAAVAQRKADRSEQRAAALARDGVDLIEVWSQRTPWSDLLEPEEWTPAHRVDSCTCEIWTRPGSPGSWKSATAHADGCTDGRYTPENAPLHVWSDNVDGGLADWIGAHGKTVSRLQFVAATRHGGDIVKAMTALGLHENTSPGGVSAADLKAAEGLALNPTADVAAAAMEPPRPAPAPAPEPDAEPAADVDLFATPGASSVDAAAPDDADPDEDPEDDDEDDEGPYRPKIAPFDEWRDLPAPTYVVDGWLEDGGLLAVIGASGVGKSAVVLDMACSISTGLPWQGRQTKRTRVLYIAGEGVHGAAQRVKAWETEHGQDVGQDLYLAGEPVHVGTNDPSLWPWLADLIIENEIGLVVFDTLARMTLGMEENSATEMGSAVARFDRIRRESQAGVLVVHHTARGQRHGRGSSAVLGSLDSEVLITEPEDFDDEDAPPPGKRIRAELTKQKNAEDGLIMDLTLCQRHGSIVVADVNGETVDASDPFAAPATVLEFARPPAPTDTEVALLLADYLDGFPVQGATATDLRKFPRVPSAYRTDPQGWAAAVKRATDRGLALGLLNTFGGDGSTRYLRGSATAESVARIEADEAADREATGAG